MTIAIEPLQARGGGQTHRTGDAIQISDPAKDLKNQINKASALSGCLRDIVWSNSYMRTDSKIIIYKTCIRPVVTYSTQVRKDTNKTKCMLSVAEMKILRTIVEKTRRGRVRNTDIREHCGIQDMVRWGRQRKRQWYDHIRRMDEKRLPRVALECNPLNSRSSERPPKRRRQSAICLSGRDAGTAPELTDQRISKK